MADLMSSMNSDAPPSAPPSLNSNTCHSCGEEFDYRDDVKTVDNQVRRVFSSSIIYKLRYNFSVTIKRALFVACVASLLNNVVHTMSMKENFIVKEIIVL